MTRVSAGLQRLAQQRRTEPERRWFCVSAEGLELGDPWSIGYTPTLASGGIVWAVKIQARGLVAADLLRVDAVVATVASVPVNLGLLQNAEKVILFSSNPAIRLWRSFGHQVDETWELRRLIRGSNQRVAIGIGSNMTNGADVRVSVLYSES